MKVTFGKNKKNEDHWGGEVVIPVFQNGVQIGTIKKPSESFGSRGEPMWRFKCIGDAYGRQWSYSMYSRVKNRSDHGLKALKANIIRDCATPSQSGERQ